jgi:integrase
MISDGPGVFERAAILDISSDAGCANVFHMIKRRAKAAALPYSTCCHTFRATGITTYLENGGTLEHAQTIANHESPRTTKLYDRTREELSQNEIEKIKI